MIRRSRVRSPPSPVKFFLETDHGIFYGDSLPFADLWRAKVLVNRFGTQHFLQDCLCAHLMRIRTVCPESSQDTKRVAKDPKRLQADSEDSDKPSLGARVIL